MHFGHKLITFAVGLAIAVGAQALPQVKILATGGTIAGSGNSATGSAYQQHSDDGL